MPFRIGDRTFDPETRELLRAGKPVPISPKAFRLLEILLEHRPKAVKKEELQDLLWPGVFVAEHNLARLMTEIRKAIGDDAHAPRLVRTVHRFGYAFSGAATADGSVAGVAAGTVVFKLAWRDREIALTEGENILGRGKNSVAWVDVHSVSRRHARILVSGDHATLEDLGSKNGTLLNGKKVLAPRALSDGDQIRIGTVQMTLLRYADGVSTQSTRSHRTPVPEATGSRRQRSAPKGGADGTRNRSVAAPGRER